MCDGQTAVAVGDHHLGLLQHLDLKHRAHISAITTFINSLTSITAPVIMFHYLPPPRKTRFPSLEHYFKQLETGIFIGCSFAPHSNSAGCPTCSAVVNISQQAGAMKNVIELSIGQGVGQQGTTSIWLHTWINEETLSGGHCDQA